MSRVRALAMLLVAPAAWADDPAPTPAVTYATHIDGAAGQRMTGVASINLVAGRGNAQANLASISIAQGRFSAADVSGMQSTAVAAGEAARAAVAHIGGTALGGGSGVLAVNQAAGAANAQLNLLALGGDDVAAHLFQSIDASALAAVATGAPLELDAAPVLPATRDARIDGAALANPQGVLQLNQTAGVGNASANVIVLQLPGGTP